MRMAHLRLSHRKKEFAPMQRETACGPGRDVNWMDVADPRAVEEPRLVYKLIRSLKNAIVGGPC